MIFILTERCPVFVTDGLKIDGSVPMLIYIGIYEPTAQEVDAIGTGRVLHKFGVNDHTAWMTLQFFGRQDTIVFQGEVFHSAGKLPDIFTDEKLVMLRTDLPTGKGIGCTIILVDTSDQRICAMRHYAWSNELSIAFLEAAKKTRDVAPEDADVAATTLMRSHSIQELAEMAGLAFDLPRNSLRMYSHVQ